MNENHGPVAFTEMATERDTDGFLRALSNDGPFLAMGREGAGEDLLVVVGNNVRQADGNRGGDVQRGIDLAGAA